MRPILVLVLVCVLAGCAPGEPPRPGGGGRDLAFDAVVLQRAGGTPVVCVGGIAESYPPQCGGLPVAGWDWSSVHAEARASGTAWGEYRLTGAIRNCVFIVSTVARPARAEATAAYDALVRELDRCSDD